MSSERKVCICDDFAEANLKFMCGWRYCAYCGKHLQTKLEMMYRLKK